MAPAKPKAAKATHGRKDLKDAAGGLHAHSSSLAFFTSRWRALEDHLSFIHLSIEDRLRELESREQVLPAASPVATTLQPSQNDEPAAAGRAEAEPEVVPRPELRSLCVNMNAKDLLAFVNDNRGELPHIHKELVPALRAAPDPATLVLDALDEFYPFNRGRKGASDAGVLSNRRSCISLLERLRMISPEIEPAVRQRAKKLAAEWELAMMPDNVHYLEAIAFLHLLVTFDIASDFEEDDLLDLLVSIVKTREAVDLCRSLGLYKRMDGKACRSSIPSHIKIASLLPLIYVNCSFSFLDFYGIACGYAFCHVHVIYRLGCLLLGFIGLPDSFLPRNRTTNFIHILPNFALLHYI